MQSGSVFSSSGLLKTFRQWRVGREITREQELAPKRPHAGDEDQESLLHHSQTSMFGASEVAAPSPKRIEKEQTTLHALSLQPKPPSNSSQRKFCLYFVTSVLVVASLIASINYLTFKFRLYCKEVPSVLAAPWLLLVLACECAYFVSSLISAVDYLLPPSIRPNLAMPDDDKAGTDLPTVHILLPCCKEPTEVPKDSIRAALALSYPSDRFKVLVLDDGGDDELRAYCETLQVESGSEQVAYLRRKKIPGVPHDFKCGNLNYGLKYSDADYVVMMDADMILHPSFLRRLMPHIINSPDVAFVQVPQAFYNLPVGDPLNDACCFGYDRVLVHRDSLGCAACVGTGALFRRKHLDEIGGFQPQSITEDTTTAFTLFNHGYKSVYLNEKLQIGLTPWTFEGYVKQRQRWGRGAIQQFGTTRKKMLGKGSKLHFVLKLCYFWHTGYYYLSIANVILAFVLMSALALRLNLTVGNAAENRTLIGHLGLSLVIWRLAWYVLWWDVPLAIQSRNRDESHFWWMTPFFFKMVMQAAWDYSSTFNFVPTSNIDRRAAASTASKGDQPSFLKQIYQLKHVVAHLVFVVLALAIVSVRVHIVVTRYGMGDCKETFFVLGLSVFMLTVCAHMLVPVAYILWPTSFKPEQRRSLLRYDAGGVARFTEADCRPRWHWSVCFYELISYATLAFWSAVAWIAYSGTDLPWCNIHSLTEN